ncbi:MAG: hypothetical protein WC789_09270 [Lentisphaeria bacterium]
MDFERAKQQWEWLTSDAATDFGVPQEWPQTPGDPAAIAAAEFLRHWADVLAGYFHAGDSVSLPATAAPVAIVKTPASKL